MMTGLDIFTNDTMLFYSRTSLALLAHSVSAQSCSRSTAESRSLLGRHIYRWDGKWLKLVHVLAHVGFYSFRNTFSICCLGIVQTLPTSHVQLLGEMGF